MAMIDIEYRHTGTVMKADDVRRNTKGMEGYLRDLIKEMRSAGISVSLTDSPATDGKSSLYINGRNVKDILEGLKIHIPEEDDHCDNPNVTKMVTMGRPVLEWNMDYAEDIPDILMKNAISKTYADIQNMQ